MTTIAGFIIVYRQGCARRSRPGDRPIPLARLGSIFYGGVFRDAWAEVHEHHYARSLPPHLKELVERMRRANRAYLGVEVCQDLVAASALLAFTRGLAPDTELIAVRSPQLLETKGRVDVDDLIQWKGMDIVTPGSASLLEEGLLRKPELFEGWESALLPTGLFAADASVDAYVAAYRAGVAKGQLENLLDPLPGYHIDAIEIGSVRDDSVG